MLRVWRPRKRILSNFKWCLLSSKMCVHFFLFHSNYLCWILHDCLLAFNSWLGSQEFSILSVQMPSESFFHDNKKRKTNLEKAHSTEKKTVTTRLPFRTRWRNRRQVVNRKIDSFLRDMFDWHLSNFRLYSFTSISSQSPVYLIFV